MATSAPAISSRGPNKLDVFVRGQNGHLWHRDWNVTVTGGWSNWTDLGGYLQGAPAELSWGPNRIDVFVRGGNGSLW